MKKKKVFSPYSKPHAPTKPAETIQQVITVGSLAVHSYDTLPVENFTKEGATHVSFDISCDSYSGNEVTLNFIRYEEVPNPRYKASMDQYTERYAIYKKELKEWNAEKKVFDEEAEKAELERKRSMYEKLKKEFEK